MLYLIRLHGLQFIIVLFCLCRPSYGACPTGDLTGDCTVTFTDLAVFADQWLDGGGSANLDGVGGITLGDFALLARDWRLSGSPLVINEFMTDNGGFILDNAGDADDWLEIHNHGTQPVNIAGLYLTDDLDVPNQWQVPSDVTELTTIPAGGYLLIWADDEALEGPLHAGFRLAAGGGEDIGLFDPDGQPIDTIMDFAGQDRNHSYGRYPDAASQWQVFGDSTQTTATPGRSNQQTGNENALMISEIMYHPYNTDHPLSEDNREEYIELFNSGDLPLDISGWRLTGGVEFEFPAGTTIDSQDYLVVAADTATFATVYGPAGSVVGGWTGRLSNRGDALLLLSDQGQVIDGVNYSDEGDWGLRRLAPVDAYGHRGWMWADEHDGLGKSLEVISTAMPNEFGHNWAASLLDQGTPGALIPQPAQRRRPVSWSIPARSGNTRITAALISATPPAASRGSGTWTTTTPPGRGVRHSLAMAIRMRTGRSATLAPPPPNPSPPTFGTPSQSPTCPSISASNSACCGMMAPSCTSTVKKWSRATWITKPSTISPRHRER